MKLKKKEKKIIYFVCLVLASIIAFGSGILLAINGNNVKPENDKTAQENTESEEAATKTTTESAVNDNKTSSNTTTTEESLTKPAFAFKPGTINNPTIIEIDEDNWHLTLVNSCYRIPDSYSPDLVNVCGTGESLDRKIALEYEKMFEAAAKDGVYLTPCSGYRSYATQERNYKNKISYFEGQGYSTEDAKVKAATIIMPPGSSEHNLGYAMDIVCVEEWFEDTAEFRWLTENAADYGFIMRYPKEKQHITNVIYEPWHWRYVGVEVAKEMKEKNLTLEEYLGVY